MKYKLIYPFFIECLQHASDKFWKNVFEDLAYGITPAGTYINKDFLTCNYKDKEFIYKIQKKDPKELHDEIYNIFKNKLALLSRDEIINRKKIVESKAVCKVADYTCWADIKKKNIKEFLIERYAIKIKNKYNLSITQTKYLVSIIFLAFIFKIFSSNDIEICDGQIINIKGIDYERGKIILKKNM